MLIGPGKGDEQLYSPCQQPPRHNVIVSICETLAFLKQVRSCLQDPVPLSGLFGWQQIFQASHNLCLLVRASHVCVRTYSINVTLP